MLSLKYTAKRRMMMSEPTSNPEEFNIVEDSIKSEQDPPDLFAIVGVGASAGGLEAFTQLLRNLPPDIGMGFVLIQHLSPDHHSQLSEILQRTTKMSVNEAVEGMKIEKNCVYVIPPNTLMTLAQGVLNLAPRELVRGKYMAINGFFSSLASDRGSQAIAIVLSGNNEDGTEGLSVIKSAGGITFAQDLDSAQFPAMPMSAAESGYVDFVLPPAEIATQLIKISKIENVSSGEIKAEGDAESNAKDSSPASDLDASEEDNDLSASVFEGGEATLTAIFTLLYNVMKVDFRYYKKGTIRRRIVRQMGLLNFHDLDAYAKYLQDDPDAVKKLYYDILISVTSFFREIESFNLLKELVFPEICEDRAADLGIRIWVAGCSTGQEAYSIAISLLEFVENHHVRYPIQIFATDISEVAIEKARMGIYEQSLLSDVSPERLNRFFTPIQGGYQITKSVRELCIFARHNLTSDPPFSRLDMISCRNMLIYLEPVLQKKIMPVFHYALNTNGFLVLGGSEGISSAEDLFTIANKKNRIYKRKLTQPRMNFDFVKSSYVAETNNLVKRTESSAEINLEQLADHVVLNRYAPAGVIVNSELEILQFRGQTSPYLEASPGKASLNLLKMTCSDLKLELRSALHESKDQDLPICKDGIETQQGIVVKIDVIPLKVNTERYFLVLFETRSVTIPPAISPTHKSLKERQTDGELEVVRLKSELESTKEYLRSIIESQESINQDLKVASEEILSSNEELQSANEELETAKEEIQATNEELHTVNEELRSRNNQLNQVNDDLQNLLSSVHIPILMLSGDLRIRRFTPVGEKLFNLISSDIGRPFSDIKINFNIPDLRALITSVIDTLTPCDQEVQDHAGRWYSLRIRPYRTTEDLIDGVVISFIDIDGLKVNTIELESSRNYVTAIIETLHNPFVVLNADLRIITANNAFYQVFHVIATQTERQSIFELGKGDWNIPKLRSLLNKILLRNVTIQDYEITQDFAEIGTRTMLLNARQIAQPNAEPMILLAIDDITERNIQKQQLLTHNKALSEAIAASDAANHAKSKFLGTMSHELRTPLNSIMGFSQILQSSPNIDSKSQQYLGIIYESGKHLLSLIQNLLDISRIDADKMPITLATVNLLSFLQLTVDMLASKVIQENLVLTTQFADNLPKNIAADENRLRQVLLNLLSNAIKFTSAGEITFTVSKIQSTKPVENKDENKDENKGENLGEVIRFAIADTGVGIAADEIEKIFLPFEQVGGAEMKPQGTGLGLAISQSLANKMGSDIKVVSEVGVGSTFSFDLDYIDSESDSDSQTNDLPNLEAISDNKNLADTFPLIILIAEDLKFNQLVIESFLSSLGYQHDTANDGLEALAKLREKHYDVILMDIQMPKMDGIETTQKILEEWGEGDRPYIIAFTADTTQEAQDRYTAVGMNAYIGKPVDFNQLKQVLHQVPSKEING